MTMLARTRHLQCNTMIEKVASKNGEQSNTEIELLERKTRCIMYTDLLGKEESGRQRI